MSPGVLRTGSVPGALRRGRVLPFRQPSVTRRLKRHLAVRLLVPFGLALALVGAPVGVVGFLYSSSLFAVTELRLETPDHGRVDRAWVRRELRPLLGANLPRLPLEQVAAHLTRKHPWIREVDLRKELPGRLHVRWTERRAAALWRRDDELVYLDQEGAEVAPFEPSRALDGDHPAAFDGDLVLVAASAPGSALEGALALEREIRRVAPRWAGELSEIEVLGEDDYRIWSSGLGFPLLVRSGNLASKNAFLEELLPEIIARYGSIGAVDLRFSRRIIVQPSVRGMGG